MPRFRDLSAAAAVLALLSACASPQQENYSNESNPFLEDMGGLGKADTGYVNPDGIEVEVDLEADVTASSYQIFRAPAELGQYALTYLRKRGEFYLESLAEDATSRDRVDWRVDGDWLTAEQARSADTQKLTHFRIRGVNAVLLHGASAGAEVGKVYTAKVPLNPFTAMADGGEGCADPDSHLGMSQSIYWYVWNPDKEGCRIRMQDMTVTVSSRFIVEKTTYPEYDLLVADSKITAVILFGQIGDDPLTDSDSGVWNMKQMARWLKDADFSEVTPAPIGQRFSKTVAGVEVVVDLYSPYDFSGLGDMSHFSNFQTALSEHEIVAYDGHSMLGASDFWSEPTYPKFYQIFLYGGCLGYEYYVRPILEGKDGWKNVDIMSSVVEVSASANYYAGPFLAKVVWALQHEYNASWKDLLAVVRNRVGDSTFGVSGARDNCFSPSGSLCQPEGPGPEGSKRYENKTPAAIPDMDENGVTSEIEVPDSLLAKSVTLELSVTHTWVGDLRIVLKHGGAEAVVWDKTGGSTRDINQTFRLDAFTNADVSGTWTLNVADIAQEDTGTLNSWALVVEP